MCLELQLKVSKLMNNMLMLTMHHSGIQLLKMMKISQPVDQVMISQPVDQVMFACVTLYMQLQT